MHEEHFRAVENLVHEWARAIDENRVEAIAELMLPKGRYTVRSRFNEDRGLPHALIDAQSAAQVRDRIKSMRLANIYEPQHMRHLISGVQIVGSRDGLLEVRSNFAVVRTLELEGDMKLFATGQARDLVDVSGERPLFHSRLLLIDSRAVETLLVIPL
ncbi:nuclear transport factor 2 family protein [Ramlibacter sp. AW1]|uniref:Nuclear transport factor 2 family protein n=1 Tax=Ramlibacter aurantiacus TaxID=2801330 RepID=A0A936ZEH0_9BURK|nr:aromatic-ring-hydroxylating dioxygenase subunit beta [Ramlibacter aurantiacus]MBL0420069.1 nuclear transport factor 2 family protein [Ramlibacter aurantiacus]